MTAVRPTPNSLPTPFPPNAVRSRKSAWNIYAFSFIRGGDEAGSSVGGGQYGGSQSGVLATYALVRNGRLALLARGTVAHERPAEREMAAGLRWQPLRQVPVSLTAERRFRNARRDSFAVYVSGGKSDIPLPVKFNLEGFAQAGFVSGKDAGFFFDGVARAERKLSDAGNVPIKMGAGIWGGGQSDLMRVDIGPTIGTEIPIGGARLRINADWRFRIAGDARPASGPALTLSTSF